MGTGSGSGDERDLVLSVFRDDEDGFTTVAVAVALLLCLTLVFAAASAGWVSARSSEVQRVADAAALAGQNAVAAYSSITQVINACVLSLGLTGVITYGAGLVASCVPGLTGVGLELCSAGSRVLEARSRFARAAREGLSRLEVTLPLLVVANSASCVAANSEEGRPYVGCAIPFPATSSSDFSALEVEVDREGLDELSERMRAASMEAQEARERVDEALERGWRADCASAPYCLWERASSLVGLPAASNPRFSSSDGWNFGIALQRARSYYAARLAAERVAGRTDEELTDAACRRAFYEYALGQVRSGSWAERSDGTVASNLPSLPRNADETRATTLYTLRSWPCTMERGTRTLHCSPDCSGATGELSGAAALSELDSGEVACCDSCGMDVGELGRVASASTSIENGFEYHWRIIVEASEDYEAASVDLAEAERVTRELAEEGEGAFEEAAGQLAGASPTVCPPGAWGCVAVVARADGATVPTELTRAFLSSAELPAGAAVSAAVLAPDESTAENNVLSSFFDALSGDSVLAGAADGLLDLWGDLLVGYGSAAGQVAEAGGAFLDELDGVLGGSVGAWLRERLKGVLEGLGIAPVDMRLRKPVLTNTQDVLDRSGLDQVAAVRELVSRLPDFESPADFARSLGLELVNGTGGTTLTVTELELPGTGVVIPLTIDLSSLAGAA